MKVIAKHKKEIIIFLIVFIIASIMCSAFYRPHYTHDTFKIVYDGYEYYSYDKFLKEARPFTAMLTIFASKINLSIENYIVISFIIALILLSISVVMIYKIFKEKYNYHSKWVDILIILISYITVFNYLAIEHIYFLECCILALGILLSIIAAKIVINDEKYKYIKAFLIIVIAVFCYQGSIAIFPMIVLTYKLLLEDNDLKRNFIDTIKVILIYGIAMLLTVLFSKFVMGGSRIQIVLEQVNISDIIYWLKELVINSLGVIPPYTNIIFILLTAIFIFCIKKPRIIYTLKYLFVILASIAICMAPVIVGTGLDLTPRMCIAYGSTIGLSLFVALFILEKNDKKYPKIIFTIVAIVIFILNMINYLVITYQHLEVNRIDKENCEIIKGLIEEYENETNIQVTKIASINRLNGDKYYPGMIHAGAITEKALNSWAMREAVVFYIGRHLQFAPITEEQYDLYFENKTWDEFSEEQIVIIDDVLYICGD